MPARPQNLANHVRFVPLYHLLLTLLLLANLVIRVRALLLGFTELRVASLCVAVALLLLFFYARQFAVTVQDRVIRLEMRLRLERLLSADLKGRIQDLTPDQFISLRFAGDEELPALVREVLEKNITDRKEIKRRVKNWQADHLRA